MCHNVVLSIHVFCQATFQSKKSRHCVQTCNYASFLFAESEDENTDDETEEDENYNAGNFKPL